MCEFRKCVRKECIVLVIAAVHRPGDLARLPDGVLLASHRLEFGEDVLPWAATLRQARIHAEALGVRVVVHQISSVTAPGEPPAERAADKSGSAGGRALHPGEVANFG